MFYGSGAGKLPTASAVVADVVELVKHQGTNIDVEWDPNKLTILNYKDAKNAFFVRTNSSKAEVEAAFGKVSFVDSLVDGEVAFTTDIMTEGTFEENASKIELVNRVRLG